MKSKPWNMLVGAAIGFMVGAVLWWSSYVRDAGLLQNPQLIIVPVALGVLIVSVRNKRRKVGSYDPDTVAQNKRGRV